MTNDLLDNPDFAGSSISSELKRTPLGFIDIGARGGVHNIVERVAKLTAVLAFEPDQNECTELRAQMATSPWGRYVVEPIALGAEHAEAQLHVLASPVNSSLRLPNPEFIRRYSMTGFEVVEKIPLKTTTLDMLLFGERDHESFWGEFIKIDTQGTEYEILQGAERTLRERTVALIVELEFFEMYLGEKRFSETEQWLRNVGFSFYGFDLHCRSAKLLDKKRSAGRERTFFADAIFFKDPLAGGLWKRPLNIRSQQVLFLTALLQGYYDFALQLALETWAKGEEAKQIRRLVENEASRLASRAYNDALALAERVRTHPEHAVVEVGKFVDARRHFADYDDVRL